MKISKKLYVITTYSVKQGKITSVYYNKKYAIRQYKRVQKYAGIYKRIKKEVFSRDSSQQIEF